MKSNYNFEGWSTEKSETNLMLKKGNISIDFDLWNWTYTVSSSTKNYAVPITVEIHYIIERVMSDFQWTKDYYLAMSSRDI